MTTKCKRCNSETVYWEQDQATGKWLLYEEFTFKRHFCQDDGLKIVKCKYCTADDLHWAEEVDLLTQQKRMVLTESYGLPHACDERAAFKAKEKQEKKDRYDTEKKRVMAEPDGTCTACNGRGINYGSQCPCNKCYGFGRFSPQSRKGILASLRHQIWPHMREDYKKKW